MHNDGVLLLLVLARIVQARLEAKRSPADDAADLEMLNRVLRPFNPPEEE